MLGEFLPRSMYEMMAGVTPAFSAIWRIDMPQRSRNMRICWPTSSSSNTSDIVIPPGCIQYSRI